MTGFADVVLLICSDSAQTKRVVAGLSATREYVQVPLATKLAQAARMLERLSPDVVLLDESALDAKESHHWHKIIGALTKHAPVVVVASSPQKTEFAALAVPGAVELVERTSDFASIVSEVVARRRGTTVAAEIISHSHLYGQDFGELLRHEMNNPLTGILGNAELLLSKSDCLPPQAAAQLQTIALLAIRLRETVKQLSEMWETARGQAHTI